jgi:hypothetical protein
VATGQKPPVTPKNHHFSTPSISEQEIIEAWMLLKIKSLRGHSVPASFGPPDAVANAQVDVDS